MQTEQEIVPKGNSKNRNPRLSKDGNWRSFSKVPNLLQYVPSGIYFARVKIDRKIIRRSLETDVWTIAKLQLPDFLRREREALSEPAIQIPTVEEAAIRLQEKVAKNVSMKERSKGYRLLCIEKIKSSWAGLWNRKIIEISEDDCKNWAAALNEEIASQYYNNVIGTLRMVFDLGIDELQKRGGHQIKNPARSISRSRIKPKVLQMPEPDQFRELLVWIGKQNSWGKASAELVEFLAYSGLRLYTEAHWVTWEDIDWKRKEIVVRGSPDTATKNWEIRRVPILPDMEVLLRRLLEERIELATGTVLRIIECPQTLKKACKAIGIPPLRHHDLRHLFATRCIEAGVDIPTVARWLGHKDGGALAMKTYGHLRNEHSRQMAEKVRF